MKGISLLVVGNPTYMMFAANLMVSIKAVNPEMQINMITEPHLTGYLPPHLRLWDYLTPIDYNDCHVDNRLMPGLSKLCLYKYLWSETKWTETVYLDVDAVALRDLTGLFDHDKSVNISIQQDVYNWLDPEVTQSIFKTDSLPYGINDSYIYIRKSKQAQKVFKDAENLLRKNPIDLAKLKNSWFKNQPDELYMSVSLANNNITPYPAFSNRPVYFRYRHEYNGISTSDIEKQYWLIGTYGDLRFCHVSIGKLYDKYTQVYYRKLFNAPAIYKYHDLMNQKHKY